MATIENKRKKIDAVDKSIVKLLNERAKLALEIGKEKAKRAKPSMSQRAKKRSSRKSHLPGD